MYSLSFKDFRRLAAWLQAAVLLTLPFVRVHGESVIRFDVPSLKLYFFGSVIWISEAFFFLLIFLLFFLGIMLITVLYGRIWCGWMCPQTVLSDVARRIDALAAWFTRHRVARLAVSHGILLCFSTLVAADLIWFFVPPHDMLQGVLHGSLGPWTSGSWLFFTMLLYLDLAFVRQRFCGSVCPYARFQSAFFDDKTLTIAFDREHADECLGCEACVHACPSGIDIRKGLQVECINCAECIDACRAQARKTGKRLLVRYFKGAPGETASKGMRIRVIGLSLAFACIAVLLAYQIYVRVPFDFWVFRDEHQLIRQADNHAGMRNSYSIIIENRGLKPAIYQLRIAGIKDAEVEILQNPFLVPSNTRMKVHVNVYVKRKDLTYRITQLRFILKDLTSREIKVEQEAPFIYPDQTELEKEI
jgi:cytochrome c oxidase accessory protein FixG